MKHSFNDQAGFALLYAVLLTGIILTIGLGLSSILTKQIILSSIGSNSQKAYYAANTIKECVLHWGIYGGVVGDANGTAFGGWVENADGTGKVFIEPTLSARISCGQIELPILKDGEGTENGFHFKKFVVGDSVTRCNNLNGLSAVATIKMYDGPIGGGSGPTSEVVATGYSPDCNAGPRRVEREISGMGEFSVPFAATTP